MKPHLRTLLKYFSLVVFGLLLGLIALEIGLRFVPDETLAALNARHLVRDELYRTDPKIGWRLKPNALVHYSSDNEFEVQVQTNSLGLNDFEHTYQKLPGTFRILLLGDSFTEGINVPIAKGFPYLLETCLNEHYQRPIEVINGGTAYYSSAEELFFLQHEGIRYNPDLVLVDFYIGNDIDAFDSRKVEDGWFDTFGGYLIELDGTGQLKKSWIDWQHPSPYERVPAFEQFLRRNSKIYYILAHSDSKVAKWLKDKRQDLEDTGISKWLTAWVAPPPVTATSSTFRDDLELMKYAPDFPIGPDTPAPLLEGWAIIGQLFDQIKAITDSKEAKLGALIIPEFPQSSEQAYQESRQRYASRYGVEIAGIAWNYAAPNQAMAQMLAQKNIPYLDLLPIYRADDAAHHRLLYFERDRHLNEIGHQVTAAAAC